MIHEFAVEPEVISSWGDFLIFVDLSWGVEYGRLISEFPRDWKSMVYRNCEKRAVNKPGVMNLKRITERLNDSEYLGKRMARLDRGYNPVMPWLRNAEDQHISRKFHAIIATSNPDQHPKVLLSADINSDCKLWKVDPRCRCKRNPESLAQCAKLLLEMSEDIVFVDPYFEFMETDLKRIEDYGKRTDRFTDTLRELINFSFRGKYPRSITLHASYKKDQGKDKAQSLERWRRDCSDRLSCLLPGGASIQVFKWQRIFGRQRLHPRFVLTELGGIYYEGGLDCDPSGEDQTMVIILSDDLHKITWRDFQVKSTPFRFIDRIEVDFGGNIEVLNLDNQRRT
jgi:hypothetical protein